MQNLVLLFVTITALSLPIHAGDDAAIRRALAFAPEQELLTFTRAPHVVVFVLDDVAAVDLDGLPLPSLDRLAAHGVTFSAAYASPTCDRTRRSLVFGEWWIDNSGSYCGGLNGNEPRLALVSLAELAPRQPALLAGKWHLGADPASGLVECGPQAHGFDSFEAGSASNVNNCGGTDFDAWMRLDACGAAPSGQYEPEAVAQTFETWWLTARGRKLAVVSTNLAHAPFHVPPAHLLPAGYPAPGNQREEFEAMIVAYDTLIGRMLGVLNPENTLVIVVGDNGTPPNAGGGTSAKGTVYERGIRVPLIVAGSMVQRPGRTSAALAHVVDVLPTVADYWGASVPSTDGLSLRAALDDLPFAGHDYVLCGTTEPTSSSPGQVCARSPAYKLRRLLSTGAEQFYVLPNETTNRIGDPTLAAEVAAHRAWLDANLP